MSGNIDRRAQRTRDLLAQALMDLGAARGVDAVVVTDLAEKAGVARSTFYAHYAGKDAFLVQSFTNLIAKLAEFGADDAVVPASPLFRHVAAARAFASALPKSEAYPAMMASGEVKLREIVCARLAQQKPDWPATRREDAAVFIAAGCFGLLRWWMESGVAADVARIEGAYTRLAHNALQDA